MATTRVRDILLKISGDASDAQRALEETANELKEFDATTYEATVDVDTTAADLKMEAAEKALEDYDNMAVEARLDLQTAGAEAQLQRLQQNLANLQARPTSPKIDIAIARTIGQIEKVEAQLDKLDRRRVEIEVDVDMDRDRAGSILGKGVAGIAGGLTSAARGLGEFGAAATRGLPVIGGLAGLLAQAGTDAGTLGPALAGAAGTISLTVIPSIAALGTSLATAAAGIPALGAAAVGAFGPAAAVGFATFGRFGKVLETANRDGEQFKQLMKDLTPAERDAARAIKGLKDALADAFRPATNAVFRRGITPLVRDLTDFAKDRQVRAGLRDTGRAIGSVLRAFGDELRRPRTREAFAEFARSGARIIRGLAPVFRSVFRVLTDVARAALPWLEEIIGNIGRAFRRWADDTRQSGLERFVERARRSFRIWIGIARELARIVIAFFRNSNDSGDDLAETLRRILRRWADWIERNPDTIKTFFRVTTSLAKGLLTVLDEIVTTIGKVTDAFSKLPRPAQSAIGRGIREGVGNALPWPLNLLQSGGPVLGVGTGDRIPALLEPGEYVLQRSVASAVGVGRLNLLNAGNLAALSGGGRGIRIENQTLVLPPAPGHDQMGDPRHQAAQFARELRRRGEVGLSGGGIP